MSKPGVMFYFDIRPCIKRLTLEEKGRLFEAILDYGEFGVVPEMDGVLGVAWDFLQPKIDRDGERYDRQVKQKQYAVFTREFKRKGGSPIPFDEWEALSDNERDRLLSGDDERYPTTTSNPSLQPQTTTSNQKDFLGADKPPTPARKKFVPPTVEQVRAYCEERGNSIDAARFVDYYATNGWVQGGGKPIKDWRACVRTWERNGKEDNTSVYNTEGNKGKTWNLPGVKPL